jgi:hypothetical protein
VDSAGVQEVKRTLISAHFVAGWGRVFVTADQPLTPDRPSLYPPRVDEPRVRLLTRWEQVQACPCGGAPAMICQNPECVVRRPLRAELDARRQAETPSA